VVHRVYESLERLQVDLPNGVPAATTRGSISGAVTSAEFEDIIRGMLYQL